jgi:hypothetical protein
MFKDQTEIIKRKAIRDTPTIYETMDSASRSRSLVRSVSPSTSDRGTAFFMHQYSFQGYKRSTLRRPRGLHEYLPALMRQEGPHGPLRTIVAAAGLAALSNAGNATTWAAESYQLYNGAIRQLSHTLGDPTKARSDLVLAAMMLMGTFEVRCHYHAYPAVVCAGLTSCRPSHPVM